MKKTYRILPRNTVIRNCSKDTLKKAAVIAHLYYADKLEHSMEYLRNIPEDVDIYVVTANPTLLQETEKTVKEEKLTNFHVLEKPNRGRDFGALFVTGKEILKTYEVVGFLHDKKSHAGDDPRLGETWERCLLESVAGSREYVCNIIQAFAEDERLGILSAPIPPEEYMLGLAEEYWTCNYENALEFLRQIDVNTVPGPGDTPLTIGSVFWFRTRALQKLIDRNLEYEDFPEEPMPYDGTLAHVLERIPEYVAEDAGYTCSYVMHNEYAQYYAEYAGEHLTQAVATLRELSLLRFRNDITDLNTTREVAAGREKLNRLADYCTRFRRVFLVLEEGNPQSDICRDSVTEIGCGIETIFSADNMDVELMRIMPYGIVICSDAAESLAKIIGERVKRPLFFFNSNENGFRQKPEI